jgi:DNA-binding NarL/FixJ family response regulator
VLIADDDDPFRDALAALINDLAGVRLVGQARDGQEMVALAAILHPDVVLTDVNMPILDGIAATRLLKSMPNPPMVVVCSCDGGSEARTAARAAGADAFISKGETYARVTSLFVPWQRPAGAVRERLVSHRS